MVNLKKIKPIGVFMILFFSALVVVLCFVVDFGVPKAYTPAQDAAYYTQSAAHMQELVQELEENEFPRLKGIRDYTVRTDTMHVRITVEKKYYEMAAAVLDRDFGSELFDLVLWELP